MKDIEKRDRGMRCLAVSWLVALGLALASVAAVGAESNGAPPRKLSALAALRPRLDPGTLREIPATCPDGRGGWRVMKDGRGRDKLLAALKAFPWKAMRYVEPVWGCHASLEVLCAPDLNADDVEDYLVRIRWRCPKAGPDAPCPPATTGDSASFRHEAILVARRDGGPSRTWHILDLVAYTAESPVDGMSSTRVDFAELPDGRVGIRCKSQTETKGSGCKVLGYWVSVLTGDRVEKVGEADPEFCLPD